MVTQNQKVIAVADFSDLTIYVIDDSAFIRRLVAEILYGFGVGKVFQAETANEAFVRMSFDPPDIVICDWQMYPIDGMSVLRRIRDEYTSRVPFIMLTGNSSREAISTALGEGADSYIVKPFSPGTLMNHLLKVILQDGHRAGGQTDWAVD